MDTAPGVSHLSAHRSITLCTSMSLSAVKRKSENDLLLSGSNFISNERLAVLQMWVSVILETSLFTEKLLLKGKSNSMRVYITKRRAQEMISGLQLEWQMT